MFPLALSHTCYNSCTDRSYTSINTQAGDMCRVTAPAPPRHFFSCFPACQCQQIGNRGFYSFASEGGEWRFLLSLVYSELPLLHPRPLPAPPQPSQQTYPSFCLGCCLSIFQLNGKKETPTQTSFHPTKCD